MGAVDIALGQLGYVEGGGADGRSGNLTKFWQALDPRLQGQPWCAVFVSWCFRMAGTPLPAIDKAYGFVYCPDAVTWAKQHGCLFSKPKVGDVVLYGTNGFSTHTGIVVEVHPDGTFDAVEGNTSPDERGSQTNGGGVYRRRRSTGWVVGFMRLPLAATTPTVPLIPAPKFIPVTISEVPFMATSLHVQMVTVPPFNAGGEAWLHVPVPFGSIVGFHMQGSNPDRDHTLYESVDVQAQPDGDGTMFSFRRLSTGHPVGALFVRSVNG